MSTPVTVRLKLDAKRRPTIPASVLDAAGVGPGEDLVARVEGPGRIVLESAGSVLAQLQRAVAEGMAAVAAAEGREPAAAHLLDPTDPAALADGGGAGDPGDAGAAGEPVDVTAGTSALEEVRTDRAADLALELERYPAREPGQEANTRLGSESSSTANGQR